MRYLHLPLICCLMFWLLPLGRFIDRAHEQQACGGQRAICLCSTNVASAEAKAEKTEYAHARGHNEQRSTSGSSGHDMELSAAAVLLAASACHTDLHIEHLYSLLLDRSLDGVPKA